MDCVYASSGREAKRRAVKVCIVRWWWEKKSPSVERRMVGLYACGSIDHWSLEMLHSETEMSD